MEYPWPHPVTLKEAPKVGYAVRHDGMLFASGYYPQVEDPAARTKEYVEQAIEYYQANGLDAAVAHYNSQESLDGQWSLTLADENDIVRVAILAPHLIGTDLKNVGVGRLRQIGQEMAAATEEGPLGQLHLPQHPVVGDSCTRTYLGHPLRRAALHVALLRRPARRSRARPSERRIGEQRRVIGRHR